MTCIECGQLHLGLTTDCFIIEMHQSASSEHLKHLHNYCHRKVNILTWVGSFVQYCHHGSKELPVYINTLLETNETVSDQFLRLVSEPMLKNINIVCTKKGE